MHIRILALLWIGTSMKDWQKKKEKKSFLSMQNYVDDMHLDDMC